MSIIIPYPLIMLINHQHTINIATSSLSKVLLLYENLLHDELKRKITVHGTSEYVSYNHDNGNDENNYNNKKKIFGWREYAHILV